MRLALDLGDLCSYSFTRGGKGMPEPFLHRESTDSLLSYRHILKHPAMYQGEILACSGKTCSCTLGQECFLHWKTLYKNSSDPPLLFIAIGLSVFEIRDSNGDILLYEMYTFTLTITCMQCSQSPFFLSTVAG